MALPTGAPAVITTAVNHHHSPETTTKKKNTVVETPNPSLSKVPVIYYLSRNGRLEQPHFMEIPLPTSGTSLRLGDFVHRLRLLRGGAIADMYSWSSKRSYGNGFVWCDLADDDPIHPSNGVEYVLKGSELLLLDGCDSDHGNNGVATSSSSCEGVVALPARNSDVGEYRIRKTDSSSGAADASTQTEDARWEMRRRRGFGAAAGTEEAGEAKVGFYGRGRARASAVVIGFISCGSITARDRSSSVVPHYRETNRSK